MLKHVHSSPHRSSSTSIRRNVVDQGSPKHVHQTSNQTSPFCITCLPKEHSKFSPNRANSPVTVEDSCVHPDNQRIPPLLSEETSENLLNKIDRDNLYSASSSNCDSQPVRSKTVSDSPVICPKCFKKKRKALIRSENVKHVGEDICSLVVKEVEENTDFTSPAYEPSSFLHVNDSTKSPNKNICHGPNTHVDTTVSSNSAGPRCSTPIESRHISQKGLHPGEDDETITSSASSSPSSPSQSSASSVASSKSPFLRSKDRVTKNDEKLFRGRLDNLSLDSSMSCSTSSKEDTLCSLSSSAISLPDNLKQTMVRIWVRCLMQEMEYKTICVSYGTTCRQVVQHLLSKFRMKHRDPNLFYLAMEVTIRKAGAEVRTCLRLDDTSFPAQLVECHPKEYSRLALRMRRGGLIRIYDESVSEGSHYKSLLVGEKISCIEIMRLVLACNKVTENVNKFALVEVWPKEGKEKILGPEEEPMIIASEWEDKEAVRFEMRRILNSTNDNASPDNVINHASPIILPARQDNEENNPNKESISTNSVGNLIIDNNNFEIKGTSSPSFDGEKTCDSNFEVSDSSSSSSEYPSTSSISSSSPLQSKSNANISMIENKYISKLKGKLDPKTVSSTSHGEIKQRRKLPKTPSCSSRISESLPLNENENGDPLCPHPKKINFKTYNDYENYFYI